MGSGKMVGGYDGWAGSSLGGASGGSGSQGAQGFQGSQGAAGTAGAQGNQGFQGAVGTTGAQGNQGFQGAAGTAGAQGNQGFQGFQGAQGAQGLQGFQGSTGTQGSQGSQGFQGGFSTLGPADAGIYVNSGSSANPTVGQNVMAEWTLANTRWYAVDGATGSDANAGFSDVSGAAAWLVAKQTLAGLAAIFPKLGNGRKVSIMIGGGGQTYASGLDVLLQGVTGYSSSGSLRATSTQTTAGSVAGADNASDVIFDGAITATGMNAGGYNPTGTLSTTLIQCVLNGGGAPGFSAEPALPFGARIRFDSATTTAALRNICRTVVKVNGTDTLQVPLDAALPATPAAGDIFYIEMPGVNIPATTLYSSANGFPISGINFTGAATFVNQSDASSTESFGANFSFCHFQAAATFREGAYNFYTINATLGAAGNQTVGACRFASTFASRNAQLSFQSTAHVGVTTLTSLQSTQMNPQGAMLGGLVVEGGDEAMVDYNTGAVQCTIGNLTATAPWRFKSATDAIALRGARVSLATCTFASGARGLALKSICDVDNMSKVTSAGGALTVESGATLSDVGVDFSDATGGAAFATLSRFRQGAVNVSTATGTNGDIRLADGTIITWAALNVTGIADALGNVLVGPVGASWRQHFSGFLLGSAGATTSYMADGGAVAGAGNVTATDYPTSFRIVNRLRFKPESNNFATSVTVTLYKNGSPTALTVTVPAGTTAVVSNTTNSVLFADGDTMAVVIANAGDATKTILGAASIEGPS